MTFKAGESGNPTGKPKGHWRKSLDEAIAWAEKKRGKKYLRHIVLMSYDDNTLAAQILRKLLPDLKSVEAVLDTNAPIQLLVAIPGQAVLSQGAPTIALPSPMPQAAKTIEAQVTDTVKPPVAGPPGRPKKLGRPKGSKDSKPRKVAKHRKGRKRDIYRKSRIDPPGGRP
jgi:hypothetical protein